ncbi:MAG: proton-conducting transporter membrane subunit [Nitrospirota bacterium]
MLADYYPLLTIAAPLAAGALTALPARLITERHYRIGAVCHAIGFGVALHTLYDVATRAHGPIRLPLFASPWNFVPSFDLTIDRLAAVMMLVISGIGALLYIYSIRYMQQERGQARYQTLLTLTITTLLCMVSSANLVMLFVFWQLLSWLLCLLTYNYAHAPTAQGSFRTFVILRAGDVAFLSGIVLAYHLYGTVEFSQLFSRAAADATAFSLLWPSNGIEISGATAVTLLIFVGAMSKSAQFPLHRWVPDTLYAPTPISALLHAGIINAGGFLINRLAPLYGMSPWTLHVVFGVGVLTTVVGASMMLTQNDIKKTLGYSTVGQMGYMIMECGLGAFALAVFHLIAHGLFKATSFLNSGSVIQTARKDLRLPHQSHASAGPGFSSLTWATGFITSLVLPLIILLAAHGVLHIPLRDAQGVVIFLFFSWVTTSQAILTLYRLQPVGSWKVAAMMLGTLLLVMFTYLFAAERFTYFLYPEPGVVTAYFQAAALPTWLFDSVIAVTALSITLGWIVIYARSHGRSIWAPGHVPLWINEIYARLYLLFVNNVYLDGLALRVHRRVRHLAASLEHSPRVLMVGAGIALAVGWHLAHPASGWSVEPLMRMFLVAAMLPLFPLHGIYVSMLTRTGRGSTGVLPVLLAGALPLAGLYALSGLLPMLAPEVLRGVGVLALVGTLYGSFKALVQCRVPHVVAYGGLAYHSIVWWHMIRVGHVTPQAVVSTASAVLVTCGLLLAWNRVRARYGDVELGRIGGLARPMPRFATLMALLVMAAIGLPPFGLFFSYLSLWLEPAPHFSFGGSLGWAIFALAWFMASWYLFRLMQRLLFGPHREDLRYDDLSRAEAAPLVLVLVLLLAIGMLPNELIDVSSATVLWPIGGE